MPEETYTNLYGKRVTVETPDRGPVTKEEEDSLIMLERAVFLHATWCAKCDTRVVEAEGGRKFEVVLWGSDEDAPHRALLYDTIPDAMTVLDDVSRPTRKPAEFHPNAYTMTYPPMPIGDDNAEESGCDGTGADAPGNV